MAQPKNALGRMIAERRERAKLTQAELAEHLQIAASTLASIEQGRIRQPGSDVINRLARFLPVTVRELVETMGYELEQDARFVESILEDEARILENIGDLLRRGTCDR